jgi:hypothetical protein
MHVSMSLTLDTNSHVLLADERASQATAARSRFAIESSAALDRENQ